MAEKLFWVWRDDKGGYLVMDDRFRLVINKDRGYAGKPCIDAPVGYEQLANFFLQEGRNAVAPPAEGYKTKTVVDMTDGEPTPTNDIEAELLKRVYRHNRINP